MIIAESIQQLMIGNYQRIIRRRNVTIHIGEYYAGKGNSSVYTLVGSCVAVCLFDPVNEIGGMNHILLPGRADLKYFDAPARYGINAMELLINKIMRLGGDRHRIVAKVFGGAHLFPSISEENGVGRKITEFVLEFLEKESIRLVSYDINGHSSRKIYFYTDTGDVYLKRIPSRFYSEILSREKSMMKKIQREIRRPAKITWFVKKGFEGGRGLEGIVGQGLEGI